MTGRSYLRVNTGNLLEVAGVVVGSYAVSALAGVAWALIAGAVAMLVAAELVYDGHVARMPLPRRPRPLLKARKLLRWPK